MKNLNTVKEVREALHSQMVMFHERRRELTGGDPSSVRFADEETRKTVFYLNQAIDRMNIQIDALTFVINEDSPIRDVADDSYYNRHDINRMTVFKPDVGEIDSYLCNGQLDDRRYIKALNLRNKIVSVGDKKFL
jgi:hypothetical protein